ncbi:hypothetical protein [Brachybacterium vulturis]|uniref:AMIN-like domain-containing (lipo)protein n=1 Tax=Brachybacterium vulturis TaxID=2017484 RepID=UPI003736FB6D
MRRRALATATVLTASMVIAGCGSDSSPQPTATTTDASPTAASSSTPTSPAQSSSDDTSPESTPTAASSPPESSASAHPGLPATVPEDTSPRSGPGTEDEKVAEVTDVRVGRHDGFDRVVVDFEPGQGIPEWDVRWLEGDQQVQEPGSGKPVEMAGNRFLEITLGGVEDREPHVLEPDLTAVVEVRRFGSFEDVAQLDLGVSTTHGTAREVGFRVDTITENPPRLVIDVAHAGADLEDQTN